MALVAGTNTVAGGTMAKAIYDELNDTFDPVTGDDDTFRRNMCAAIARAIVGYIKDNGDVVITPSMSGLQRTPDPNNANAATQGPAANVTLSGAID